MFKVARYAFQRDWCTRGMIQLQPMCSRFASGKAVKKTERSPLVDSLERRIRVTGPLTIADYMRECLIHPQHGYYMKNDVFGAKGDFITSPEISQMFGELLGVWVAAEWDAMETNDHLHIIELGPGRGTLASDMLRTLSQFDFIKDKISLHLIDASPKMIQMQQSKLCDATCEANEQPQPTKYKNIQVSWHQSIGQIPITGRCCFIAHEFFDALPIHKFQRESKDKPFHEVLIDIDESSTSPYYFREVLSPSPNANSKMLINPEEERDHVEVSPLSGMIAQEIGSHINKHGGFGLFADYGHDGNKEDTFRGFKSHKLHNILETPGEADLTADVDFYFLRHCLALMEVITHGPLSQQTFLHNMGISVRLNSLLSQAKTDKAKTDLLTSYKMLCSPDEMGDRFKFLSIHPKSRTGVPTGWLPASLGS